MPDNTEPIQNELDSKLFELDAAFADPVVEEALKQARLYRDLLKDEIPPSKTRAEIIQELDSHLAGAIGTVVKVFGNMTNMTPDGEYISTYVDTHNAIFQGFTMANVDPSQDGDDDELPKTIKFLIYIPMNEEEQAEYGGTHRAMAADLDSVNIEFNVVSFERAKAWLSSFIPELIDEIDRTLLNEPDQLEPILALSNFDIRIENVDDELMARKCIGIYLNELIPFDQEVPYEIKLQGISFVVSDEEGVIGTAEMNKAEKLARLRFIRLAQVDDVNTASNHLRICLDAELLDPDPNQVSLRVLIPIETITSLTSIRNFYYN